MFNIVDLILLLLQRAKTNKMEDRHYLEYPNFFKTSKKDVETCPVPVAKLKSHFE